MTARPASALTHSDEIIRRMAVFLQKLAAMPAAHYRELATNASAHRMHRGY